jgi:outer membrane protein
VRYLLSVLSIFLVTNIYATEQKQSVTIGVGAYMQTQPYKGVDPLIIPSPVIFFDNSIFYIRWSRAGIYFYGDKGEDFSWGFSLTAQPRTFGYKESDSTYLKGMDERETTFEGGLAFSAQKKDAYIEIMLLTDVLDRYDSWLIKTEIGDKYTLGDFSFYPSFIFSYQSKKFVDYYYGVTEQEATLTREKFTPSGGIQAGVQTYIKYPLTESFATLINLRADMIPYSAFDSPIIEDKVIYSGLASIIYTFDY